MRWTILTAMLLPALALADLPYQPTLRWEGPTEWVSGAPLDPATDLLEYRLYCEGFEGTTETFPADGNEWTAPPRVFAAGEHTCYMTAVALDGSESDPSNTRTFEVATDRPAPMVIFEVR